MQALWSLPSWGDLEQIISSGLLFLHPPAGKQYQRDDCKVSGNAVKRRSVVGAGWEKCPREGASKEGVGIPGSPLKGEKRAFS